MARYSMCGEAPRLALWPRLEYWLVMIPRISVTSAHEEQKMTMPSRLNGWDTHCSLGACLCFCTRAGNGLLEEEKKRKEKNVVAVIGPHSI